MKVKIFGKDSFETKWIPHPRGWLGHRFLCDGSVVVHDIWYLKGYQYAATYDPDCVAKAEVFDWVQEHAPNEALLHPNGAVLFKDQQKAVHFKMMLP